MLFNTIPFRNALNGSLNIGDEYNRNVTFGLLEIFKQLKFSKEAVIDAAPFRKILGAFWNEDIQQDADQFGTYDLISSPLFCSFFLISNEGILLVD